MEIKEFEQTYGRKGGMKYLSHAKDKLYTLKFIAAHYDVSPETVRLWFKEFFGINYDPRYLRREEVINRMLKFAETHSLEEFREAYYYVTKHYYEIALQEAFIRGIYKEEQNGRI